MNKQKVRVLFSHSYTLRTGDIYKPLEVEVRVPIYQSATESGMPSRAEGMARNRLTMEARSLASKHTLEIVLTNVEIVHKISMPKAAVYSAKAEAYLHNAPQRPATSRIAKIP